MRELHPEYHHEHPNFLNINITKAIASPHNPHRHQLQSLPLQVTLYDSEPKSHL